MTEEIRQGDVLDRLREMPDGSVQCVITSPPYYGLRDYGTDVWEGGDPECEHRQQSRSDPAKYVVKSTLVGTTNTQQHQQEASYRQECGLCGARRVSPWVGGDPDCEHYTGRPGAGRADGIVDGREQRNRDGVAALTSGECAGCGARRAGRWTGGDPGCDHSMAGSRIVGNAPSLKSTLTTNNGAGPRPGDKFHADQRREIATDCPCGARWTTSQLGLEQTPDEFVARLVEIFSEVRRVLRHDGVAWLNLGDSYSPASSNMTPGRTARIGYTRNGTQQRPPRSGHKVKDLLGIPWMVAFALRADGWYLRSDVIWAKPNPMPESVTDRPTSSHEHVFLLAKSARYFYDAVAIREPGKDWTRGGPGTGILPTQHYGAGNGGNAGLSSLAQRYRDGEQGGGRNKRNVWEIATQPYGEAHFATFPTKLVEPCLLAGSSPKACGQCGAPWRRMTETAYRVHENWFGEKQSARHSRGEQGTSYREPVSTQTTGWEPTCAHRDDSGRSLVLDPFAGSGTVGVVARWHGRNFVGIELNAEYCAMARRRIMREGNPGRRAEKLDEPKPGQMAMDID